MPSAVDNTLFSLALLAEYVHTLDSLPIDLSRNFADLRELDAVLSSSVLSITAKAQNLTTMIEEGKASKEDRLWLLTEIADEAQRLKLGAEDKIRVACQAADGLKAHASHLRALTEQVPGFDTSMLERKTVYPHVSERSYMPATTMETGRRRRGVLGSLMTNPDPSPAKRKRVPKDDDVDVDPPEHPRDPPTARATPDRGTTPEPKSPTERAASPSESLVSVTSHLPPQVGHSTSARGGTNSTNARAGNAAASGNSKRSRAGANSSHNRNPTPLANEAYPAHHDPHHSTNGHANGSRRGAAAAADAYSVPPAASHPSLPLPYQNGHGHASGHLGNGFDVHGIPHNIAGAQDWNIPRAQQLEGPGMPVARSASIHSTAASLPVIANNAVDPTDAGDGDGDGDDRTYCFCDGVSYGEMIACDDAQCEREWFHLACIGLTVPPEGRWFCEACKNRKSTKRAVRGGKRRTGGNRASAKS
ncbi:hypothetical protein BDZ97DRAFT_1919476 [Flammula alnicola]|nr:hypothetical protein BDZ97DRAFT_1919476 [Flammula alnicola]